MKSFAVVALLLIAAGTAAAGTSGKAKASHDATKKPAGVVFNSAAEREKALRARWEQGTDAVSDSVRQARSIVLAYETVVRQHPTSGYCDNALWQAALLERDLFARSHQESDKQKSVSLFQFLAREYPTSPFARKAAREAEQVAAVAEAKPAKKNTERVKSAARPAARPVEQVPAETGQPVEPKQPAEAATKETPATPAATKEVSTIRSITRTVLPEIVRVSIELDRGASFHQERVDGPPRLLFDFPSTRAASQLQDANLAFDDDVIRKIRVGRHPNETTRVVLDLQGVGRYTVVEMLDPHRIVVDCERQAGPEKPAAVVAAATPRRSAKSKPEPKVEDAPVVAPPEPPAAEKEKSRPTVDDADLPPAGGRVSMSRQLGLGVSRVVIDPGHGGHDPGAEGAKMSEAAIVLDIGLRLEKLLLKQAGVDVTLTRREDVFVPLEERTAIANREHADLFLSIHANASRNQNAHGIESYYLNFATNPEAEAVAARENAVSGRTMNNLPEIVWAIALNNKVEESKDFAALVQQALANRLRQANKPLKNLGVKQAPFVVLIGAAMPSVLAEVSFVTNRNEGRLLTSEAYRQRIAEALCDAVLRYRRTLKAAAVVAHEQRSP